MDKYTDLIILIVIFVVLLAAWTLAVNDLTGGTNVERK